MRIKFLILFFFLLLIAPSYSFSQVIDSLINLIDKTESPEQKVELWNKISSEQQPIGGKEAAKNALKLAKEINYTVGEAEANYYLGAYYYLKENQDAAKAYFQRALALYDSLGRQEDKAETLLFLGEIKYFEKEYQAALKYFQEMEDIAITQKDNKLLALAYQNIAYIYIDGLANKQLGEAYLLKCNTILEKNKFESSNLIQNQLELANFNIQMQQMDKALLFLEKGQSNLDKIDSSGWKIYMQHSFNSMKGTYYVKMEQYDSAKMVIEKCLPFFKANKNWYAVAWSYTDLSYIYLKKKNYSDAISYAKESMELDVTNNSLEENTKQIRDAFKHLNQDSFHVYNEKYVAILRDTKKIKDINELQEALKKEELAKKEAELIQEKTNTRNIGLGIIFLTLVYLSSLFFYYKKAKKKKSPTNDGLKTNPVLSLRTKEMDLLKQKVNTIERSLLAKEIDLERQQSSLDNAAQVIKKIATNDNPVQLKKSIQALSHQLDNNLNKEKNWESFSKQFEQIHPDFFSRLRNHTPSLSIRETRLCAYGRLGMTNLEVAQILGIANGSVSKARHRLKKKLNLEKEQDLNQFLVDL